MGVLNPYDPTKAAYPGMDTGGDLPPEIRMLVERASALQRMSMPMAGPEEAAPSVGVGRFRVPGSVVDNAAPSLLSYLRSRGPAVRPGADLNNVLSALGQVYLGSRMQAAGGRAQAHAEDMALAKEQRGRLAEDTRSAQTQAASALATWRHQKNGTSKQPPPPLTKEQAALIPGLKEGQVVDTQTYGEVLRRSRPKSTSAIDQGFDPDAIADGIYEGTKAPMPSGYARGQWGKVETSLRKKYPAFNVARAQNTWVATNTFTKSLNGRLQLQLHNSAAAVQDIIPVLKAKVDELDKLAPTTDATPINKLLRGGTVSWGANGRKAQAIAQEITTMMTNLQPELANVYSAGGVPTDKAQALVEKTFNIALPVHALKAGLNAENTMLNVRLNAIANAQPMLPGGDNGQNPYIPNGNGLDVRLPHDPGRPPSPIALKRFETDLYNSYLSKDPKKVLAGEAAAEAAAKAAGVPADSIEAIRNRVLDRLPKGGKK